MKLKLIFAWYDIWIGAFWDSKKRWLYVFPIPMFGLIIKLKPKIIKKCNWCENALKQSDINNTCSECS